MREDSGVGEGVCVADDGWSADNGGGAIVLSGFKSRCVGSDDGVSGCEARRGGWGIVGSLLSPWAASLSCA